MKKLAISYWGTCATNSAEAMSWLPVEILKAAGFEIVPVGEPAADWFVAFEHNPASLSEARPFIPVDRRVLVSFEPRAVNPGMYSTRVRRQYGHVLVPNERHKQTPQDQVYGGGGLSPHSELIENLGKYNSAPKAPETIAMVNENKFSVVPGALYTLRARTIKRFLAEGVPFNLGGKHWTQGWKWHTLHLIDATRKATSAGIWPSLRQLRIPLRRNLHLLNYSGAVESSVGFMSNFEYAVVIENEASYITEKLFNAIQAGAVPIFVGPALADFGIPQDVAVQVEGSSQAIFKAFKETTPEKRQLVRSTGLKWIRETSTYEVFSHEASFNRIGSALVDVFNRSN